MAIGARAGARRDDKLELEISSAPVLMVKKEAGGSLPLRMGHVHGGTDLGLEAGLTLRLAEEGALSVVVTTNQTGRRSWPSA
jgi:hypothetical protein